MDELSDFLRSRHVPEEDMKRMEQEKIDSTVINLMTDDQLREYLPSYGDRLGVFGYCRRKEIEPSSRKSKICERLRAKISKNKGDHMSERECQNPAKNAQKNQRKIEMGWLLFREGVFVQVRTKKGGGTRKESVPKETKKLGLIEKAVQLFFPDGRNSEGSLTDFEINLTDFQQHSLEDGITVGEMYEKTKLPLIRFYLTTKRRENVSGVNLEESSVSVAREGEETPDRPNIYCHSSDTSTTEAVEINTSGVIYIGNSAMFGNASNESNSLFHSTVDPMDASSLPEHEPLLHVDALEQGCPNIFP